MNISLSLQPLVDEIRNNICDSKSVYFNEIKYFIQGNTGWVWIDTNDTFYFIIVKKSRGKKVLEKYFDSFSGVAICDGWIPYHIFNMTDVGGSHMREAKHNAEKLETDNAS